MTTLGYHHFLKTLPTLVQAQLPPHITLRVHQPNRWIIQFYDQDRRVHYEVQRIARREDFELGLHFESRQTALNDHLLQGFTRRMIEIRSALGPRLEAEPWDRGWTKVYEIYPGGALTEAYQQALAARLVTIVSCLHPILLQLYELPVERRAA